MDRSETPTQAKPAFVEFLEKTQGTLPEVIRESDLPTLNTALGILFGLLREARRQFEEEDDEGRAGAFTALGAYWMFVVLFEGPLSESLQFPILRLQDALVSLDNNSVEPILKPVKRVGRAPSSHAHATLKGHASGTVRRLMEAGMDGTEAHKAVATLLRKSGVRAGRGSGQITATTIKNWCVDVSSDFGRHTTAALMHDSLFTEAENRKFSVLTKDEARRFALSSLENWVLTLFPGSKPS